jgi:hypothetical protein
VRDVLTCVTCCLSRADVRTCYMPRSLMWDQRLCGRLIWDPKRVARDSGA